MKKYLLKVLEISIFIVASVLWIFHTLFGWLMNKLTDWDDKVVAKIEEINQQSMAGELTMKCKLCGDITGPDVTSDCAHGRQNEEACPWGIKPNERT